MISYVCFEQATQQPNLETWGVWLTILTTSVIGVTGMLSGFQFLNFRSAISDARRAARDVTLNADRQLAEMAERYKLAVMKPPVEILAEVHNYYDPRLREAQKDVDRRLNVLMQQYAQVRKQQDEDSRKLTGVPSRDSLLVEIQRNLQLPAEAEDRIVQRVLNALKAGLGPDTASAALTGATIRSASGMADPICDKGEQSTQ